MSDPRKSSVIGPISSLSLAIGVLLLTGGCPTGPPPGANEVFMRGIAFDPLEIVIDVGESVTWTNMDTVPHTATSGSPGDGDFGSVFRSAQLSRGETFTHTFDESGEFIYFCEVHPGVMRDARVIVQVP